MPAGITEINEWRMKEFQKNNDPSHPVSDDIVCLSHSSGDKGSVEARLALEKQAKTMFVSSTDSDFEERSTLVKTKQHLPTKPTRKRYSAVVTDDSDEDSGYSPSKLTGPLRRKRKLRVTKVISASRAKQNPTRQVTKTVEPTYVEIVNDERIPQNLEGSDTTDKSDIIMETSSPAKSGNENRTTMPNPKPNRPSTVTNGVKLVVSESDSDLSLFELDTVLDQSKLPTKDHTIRAVKDRRPVNQNNNNKQKSNKRDEQIRKPQSVIDPKQNGKKSRKFSSDKEDTPQVLMQPLDSSSDSDSFLSSKGKQPANKKRRIPRKCSSKMSSEIENLKKKSTLKDSSVELFGEKLSEGKTPITTQAASPSTVPVKVGSPAIIIPDDDDDDEVLIVTSRSQQETEDLEMARRLQAQFDSEMVSAPRVTTPDFSASAGSAFRTPVAPNTPESDDVHTLPNVSQRLLEALGGSGNVTELLSTPNSIRNSRQSRRAVDEELANVQQRLETLQQLALQHDYIDDTVISQVLGLPSPSRRRDAATTSSGRGRHRGRPDSPYPEDGMFSNIMGFFGMQDEDAMDYDTLLDLSERIGQVRQRGITRQEINRLPTHVHNSASNNSTAAVSQDCHICMCKFEDGEQLRMLTCFHSYHTACIDKWLTMSATCPVCRERVTLE